MKKFITMDLFIRCTRAYSLPMSVMAWIIPFVFGVFAKGNILYGLLALIGIAFAHLGSNMFDDFIDYKRHLKENNQLQKGKCSYFLNNELSQKKFFIIMVICFVVALAAGLFFIFVYKFPIAILMAVAGALCLIYPRSSYFGVGELIIGVIFSPLAFTGVYYVMAQSYSLPLLWLSIPFAIMVVALLYAHSFLDFNYDVSDGKKTLCVLCGNKEEAYRLLVFLIITAYFLIFAGVTLYILPPVYFLTYLSGFWAMKLFKGLQNYIDKEPCNEKEFLEVFNKAQALTVVFTLLVILCSVLSTAHVELLRTLN